MDAPAFDAATERLARLLSRRRSLGLLAALGAGTLSAAGADAGKKKRKKKGKKGKGGKGGPAGTCQGCTPCQSCVAGACQPVADETPCGSGGVCKQGVCALRCGSQACPDGAICYVPPTLGKAPVCVRLTSDPCGATTCQGDGNCPAGSICRMQMCSGPLGFPIPTNKCAQVATA